MARVIQVNVSEGDLFYCVATEEDELQEHMVGNPNWGEAKLFSDHDLFDCRLSLMNALQRIEDQMEERQLIGRITPSGGK